MTADNVDDFIDLIESAEEPCIMVGVQPTIVILAGSVEGAVLKKKCTADLPVALLSDIHSWLLLLA